MDATDTMTDLEFVDHYIENSLRFVNPRLLGEASRRNLVKFIDYLPKNVNEAKSVVRARMAKAGKFFNDPEVDQIAGEINRLEVLRKELNKCNLADAHEVIPILEKMSIHSNFVRDYFKPTKIY
jgi:hypothetical protein